MTDDTFDKTGTRPLKVPGSIGLPHDYELPYGERFAHGTSEWIQLPGITTRELAMTEAINRITDKHEWSRLIHDEQCTSEWKDEAQQLNELLSDKAWAWCVAELRDKAAEFDKKHFVRVLDAGSSICKTDDLLDNKFATALKAQIDPLLVQHKLQNSNHDLVDPYMWPLRFGKTRVLKHGVIKLPRSDAEVEAMYPAVCATMRTRKPMHIETGSIHGNASIAKLPHARRKAYHHSIEQPMRYFWSSKYQCLPCEVRFAESGVKIVSYINNLHPRHVMVYQSLELVIGAAVKLWNTCLIYGPPTTKECTHHGNQYERGGIPLRIIDHHAYRRYGIYPSIGCERHKRMLKYRKEAEAVDKIMMTHPKKWRTAPISKGEPDPSMKSWPTINTERSVLETMEDILSVAEDVLRIEFVRKEPDDSLDGIWDELEEQVDLRSLWPALEPGDFFSYDEWKDGRRKNEEMLLKKKKKLDHDEMVEVLASGPVKWPDSVKLEESFKQRGLQVIVGIDEVELLPGECVEHDWQLDGPLNNHIVATAIYAYDVSNIDCSIAFSQETPTDFSPPLCGDAAHTAEKLPTRSSSPAGTGCLREYFMSPQSWDCHTKIPMQDMGAIQMNQGRLIAFPNTVERASTLSLLDKAIPGYFRTVKIQLVDPNYPILSTHNIPPQQSSWWSEMVARILRVRLPTELVDEILQYYRGHVSEQEAMYTRDDMLEELEYFNLARHSELR